MNKEPQNTINKSLLLNWLYQADKDLPLDELGRWIAAKTEGKYVLIKADNAKPLSSLDEIKHK
ncbi:hypothetical protein Trichorick_01831 (plasmid) [Candidatus Trichorickettsia mobilis]|jgi:hypothetical protein|uniref:hypothetical protein n=1 Tax=Candidatus Trichorickettsia mobilis TaxID=1346319 RepID=UPI002B2599BF|nr:hypothetical protein [Candidatus Trichorickettsia mobilis]WPY01907.1 hypothetical protein Trichorick_01831 [Candidatus Trichorickettsia mobilis]